MAPHTSALAWKIPWMEEPGGLQSIGLRRVGHNWVTSLSLFTSCIGEGNGNPLQCSCLENPRDGGAWWAAVCGVAQSRTRLKRLSSSSSRLKFLRAKTTHLVLSSLPQHLALYLEIVRHEKIHAEWVDGFGWMDGLEVLCPSQATVNCYKQQKGKESFFSKHSLHHMLSCSVVSNSLPPHGL